MPSLSGASTVLGSTLFLDCSCNPVCNTFHDQTAGQRTYSLSPPQGIFALQKSLRGDCGGDGVPSAVGNSSPRAKKFPEEICFAPSRVLQICRTPRLAVAQKYVTTPDWSHVRVGQPQGARGTTVPLFREASRGTPFKGFLWATSSRRLDTALLCAAKKRGVEKWTVWWSPPDSLWRLPPRTAETYSSSCSGSTRSIEMTRLPSSTLMRMTPCVSRL